MWNYIGAITSQQASSSVLYPGCRNAAVPKPLSLFQKLFPLFQKYITGYVSQELAGERAAVVANPEYSQSVPIELGKSPEENGKSFVQKVSPQARDDELSVCGS